MKLIDPETKRPLFVTVKQTAVLLGVCEKTVYRLLDRRLLKASPHLRRKLITIDSVSAFAESANL